MHKYSKNRKTGKFYNLEINLNIILLNYLGKRPTKKPIIIRIFISMILNKMG